MIVMCAGGNLNKLGQFRNSSEEKAKHRESRLEAADLSQRIYMLNVNNNRIYRCCRIACNR